MSRRRTHRTQPVRGPVIPGSDEIEAKRRRVVIEEQQENVIDRMRTETGFSPDISVGAHDVATFRLITQRKELDTLVHAEVVMRRLEVLGTDK